LGLIAHHLSLREQVGSFDILGGSPYDFSERHAFVPTSHILERLR
jgi:hypothetical protein